METYSNLVESTRCMNKKNFCKNYIHNIMLFLRMIGEPPKVSQSCRSSSQEIHPQEPCATQPHELRR